MSLAFFISLFNAQHISDVLTASDIKLFSLYSAIKMIQ